MRYEELRPIGVAEAAAGVASADPAVIADALLRASLSEVDAGWVEAACLRALARPEIEVRRLALVALGHLARRYGRLDIQAVSRAIEPLRAVPELAGTVDDLLSDVEMFVR